MKSIAADINEQFLNIDNKFLKTFLHLFKKPDAVINGFINGTRKKYVNVIQYFAISLTLVGIQVFLMNTFFKEAMEIDPNMFGPMANPENQENNPFKDLKYEDYNNYQSVFYVLSIPFSAISTWLAYWIAGLRQYNFTEHLILNLYYSAQVIIINAFVTIILLCLGVDFILISTISTIFIFCYFFYVLKRVFNTSILMTLAYFLLVMAALGFIFIIIMILLILIVAITIYFIKSR
ncbi:DUF3667 domain-containing protein [Psychroserpens sp.]|uniref:DUF3667 domain-containing protein n=1 Tax=Psychroserpens sp. TaxID=2020870 RepID=UPI00385D02E5